MAVPLSPEVALNLVGHIYDCALYPERWPDTLTALRLGLRFHNASLALMALPGGKALLHLTSGIEPEWEAKMADYAEDIVETWGGHEVLSRLPLNEPQVLTWVSPEPRWRKSRFFQEWAKPQGLCDTMALGLARDAASIGSLGFGRHEEQGPIGAQEMEAARLLLPHAQRTIAISRLLDVKSAAAQSLEATLDTLSAAVMLVDQGRRIIHANTAARTMVAKGDPIASRQGVLSLTSATVTAALDAALVLAAENEAGMGRRGFGIPAPGANGSPHVLHVLPLKHGALRAGLSPSAVAAIFVAAAISPRQAPGEALAALFDLTAAETRILEKLTEGLTAPEAAAALGIASNTMKTHLTHMFQKTGTKRQAELVSLANSLSMPA